MRITLINWANSSVRATVEATEIPNIGSTVYFFSGDKRYSGLVENIGHVFDREGKQDVTVLLRAVRRAKETEEQHAS